MKGLTRSQSFALDCYAVPRWGTGNVNISSPQHLKSSTDRAIVVPPLQEF